MTGLLDTAHLFPGFTTHPRQQEILAGIPTEIVSSDPSRVLILVAHNNVAGEFHLWPTSSGVDLPVGFALFSSPDGFSFFPEAKSISAVEFPGACQGDWFARSDQDTTVLTVEYRFDVEKLGDL